MLRQQLCPNVGIVCELKPSNKDKELKLYLRESFQVKFLIFMVNNIPDCDIDFPIPLNSTSGNYT